MVLGDFSTEHRPRLNRIAAELSSLGYAPLFLDEVPDVIGDYDLSRKFDILAGTAKFVVFDDSSRSGHFFELERAGVANLVTLILRLEGTHSSAMSSGRSLTSKVVREFSYREETLPAITREGADWAEKVIAGLHQERRLMHPWMSEEKTPLPGGA